MYLLLELFQRSFQSFNLSLVNLAHIATFVDRARCRNLLDNSLPNYLFFHVLRVVLRAVLSVVLSVELFGVLSRLGLRLHHLHLLHLLKLGYLGLLLQEQVCVIVHW
jgi:hypothetical protein